jgi:hypothetical protein
MTVDVVTDIVIGRSVDAVAAFAANPENAPRWYSNIDSVEWRTAPPLQVGSRIAFVARFMKRRLEYTYEVVEWAPGRRLVMRTSDAPFPMETTYEWFHVREGNTRMTLRNRGAPTGFPRVVTPFLAWAVRRANRSDLEQLKERLEQM